MKYNPVDKSANILNEKHKKYIDKIENILIIKMP